jgi:CIC family chloride channel protein
LFGLTLLIGVVCGFVAVAFHLAIQGAERLLIDRALHAPGSQWVLWTVLTPTLGGLFAGAALTWIVPGARGSGIPQVKAAYALEGGRVRFRDALGKFIIGSLQIGSGASLGREGPTAQICAGATSLLARLTALPARNVRRLMPVGVAAGIAAAFNAPVAAVTFTTEEIVGTLDNTLLSGVVVAAALAAVIERGVFGVQPVIQVKESYGLEHASSLATYALLGIAAAVVSVVFTDGLLKLRLWFRGLRGLAAWAQPAVGGFVTGGLAALMLYLFNLTGVTGGGYDTLSRALAGELGLRPLLVLCAAKLIATVFSYSSGGAGGIFAPALFVGAMLGGAFGYCDVLLFGHGHSQLGAFALVGMGAVFAGVIRAPITSVLIIFEMTGGYGLVLPLMLANMTAYALARRWRETPVYDGLLEQDGIQLPHPNTRAHPLEQLTVAHAMTTDVCALRAHESMRDAVAELHDRTFSVAPVIDEHGSALGCVPLDALRRAALASPDASVDPLITRLHSIRADALLAQAIVRMTDLGVRQLCVQEDGLDQRVVGIIAMSDVVRAHARAVSSDKTRWSVRSSAKPRRAS